MAVETTNSATVITGEFIGLYGMAVAIKALELWGKGIKGRGTPAKIARKYNLKPGRWYTVLGQMRTLYASERERLNAKISVK